ncbi:MAG: HD domain-containing protein [Ruminococcus sp.]|nr:HD domain-containing protein [Ruminococcus sp.]
MIYTELTVKAMHTAYNAHSGQTDKNGVPYIFHPFHLAEQMDTENEICTALLHDVAEDTDISLSQLAEIFPEEVINALELLTHDENTDYFEYVRNIRSNPTAKKVKLADLRHNSDLSRMTASGIVPSERDIKRREKYLKAIEILNE